ncbi:uncharacterized protein LOC132729920 isoform X2 [Ruditapes philippinarum]|uniref:uncharacterized protein LOC132729920 isoform X2 n=1 Tax=Ruditapes philippinarum TaxID=129788 RepID=UPI00295B4203|nr:uncharacterized protein LOC132729920 isoform X2 [Ruditapes philippinarum]
MLILEEPRWICFIIAIYLDYQKRLNGLLGCTNRALFIVMQTTHKFGPRRAYDSLNAVCSECELTRPEQLTSTNLRKYMATLCQVMNLAPNELQQVCRHLGHTTKVHLNHYRTMSPYIERVNIGKILLMQDLNLQSNFVGKKLEEVEFTEMFKQQQSGLPLQEHEACETQGARSVDGEDEEMDEPMMDLEETDEEGGEERMEFDKSAKPSKSKKKNRQRWTEKEVKEIHLYLGKLIESGKTPSKKDCVKAKQQSLKNGGELHRRYWHLIVKKVSAMIQKNKKIRLL